MQRRRRRGAGQAGGRSTRRELGRSDAEVLGDSPHAAGRARSPSRDRRAGPRRSSDKQKKRVSPRRRRRRWRSTLYRLEVEQGRFITDDDLREAAARVRGRHQACGRSCSATRRELAAIAIDASTDVQWTVVGVLKNKPLLGGGGDGHVDVEPQGARAAAPPSTRCSTTTHDGRRDLRARSATARARRAQMRLALASKVIESTLLAPPLRA